jgi:hypothetical protein
VSLTVKHFSAGFATPALLTAACSVPGCSGDASLGGNKPSIQQDSGTGGPSSSTGGTAGFGGTGPSGGSGSLDGTGGGVSGAGGACELGECLRALECVEACSGPVLSSGCCPCPLGTFDRIRECSADAGNTGGSSGGAGADAGAPSELNTPCASGTCPSGLTPVTFYGMAGDAGPQFCWCTIACEQDPGVCPAQTTCQNIADGPGLVCYASGA